MDSLIKNLNQIKSSIPNSVELVAVSKTKPSSSIEILYEAGQRVFGENRVEELVQKHQDLPKDIEWHMIGHLQSKKVKKIAPFISLIHSVDSLKLLTEINKEAEKNNRNIDCLLQFHIAKEEAKYGLIKEDIKEFVSAQLTNITIKGVMGMATFTDNESIIRDEFSNLKLISKQLLEYLPSAKVVSMGMSGDYSIAIQEGSNMIRVGSTIFGKR